MRAQPHGTLRRLVDLAVASDEPERLVTVAGAELGCSLGLAGPAGEALGWAPDDESGQRALTVARAAARSSVVPPRGWTVVEIAYRSSRLGMLAAGGDAPAAGDRDELLDLLVALLSDQLRRAELVRLQGSAFVRRLVTDPPLAPHRARREAADLGIALADAYRVGIVAWRAGAARAESLELIEREAHGMAPEAMTALLNGHLVLLHPAPPGVDGGAAAAWFERVTRRLGELAPASRARGIAHEGPLELAALSRAVAALAALSRFGPRARDERRVSWTRAYALDRLLATEVRASSAAAFVREQIGPLDDWDRRHGSDLLRIVEAALDHPRHDEAARRCYVHRNTFRHRLRQALEILGDPLDDPDVRLAVHVALKLRHLVGDAVGEDAARHPAGGRHRRGARDGAGWPEPGRVRAG